MVGNKSKTQGLCVSITAHEGYVITACFVQINFAHFIQVRLILTHGTSFSSLFPSSNLERKRNTICSLTHLLASHAIVYLVNSFPRCPLLQLQQLGSPIVYILYNTTNSFLSFSKKMNPLYSFDTFNSRKIFYQKKSAL